MSYRRCKTCQWRRRNIAGGETDAPADTCDSAHPQILERLHTVPCNVWQEIISSNRLCSPTICIRNDGRKWARIPLRCDTDVHCGDRCYKFDGRWKAAHETVLAFHITRLDNLVWGTRCWDHGNIIGNGILKDGRLRYGCCKHERNTGVKVCSYSFLDNFVGYTGKIQLEVQCTGTTILEESGANVYCINGPKGEICYTAALIAIHILADELPGMIALS